jgi:hypothetical protein
MGLHGLLRGRFTFLYIDNVPASQETHLWVSTDSYGDSLTSLYGDDVRVSQETHLWLSTASYGVDLLLYI